MRSPCAVTSTPEEASTSASHAGSRAEHPIARRRGSRQEPLPELDDLGQVDRQPADTAVVDAPELRLEPLSQRDDGGVRPAREIVRDRAVEAERAQRLPLGERLARAEPLLERKVDLPQKLDCLRVAKGGSGTTCLDGAVVERPQQRLGHPVELDSETFHQLGSSREIGCGRYDRSSAATSSSVSDSSVAASATSM
jgi:hypothetical protein